MMVVGFSFEWWKKLFRYAYPLFFAALFYIVQTNIDKFLVKGYIGLQAVGVYSLAFTFGFAITELFTIPFSQIWVPYVFSKIKDPHIKELTAYMGGVISLVVFTVFFLGTTFIKDIMIVLAGEEFWGAYKVVPFFLFTVSLNTFLVLPNTGFQVSKKTKYLSHINLIKLILVISLNLLLLPKFGIIGGGLSLTIASIVACFYAIYASRRCYFVPYNWRKIFTIISISVIFAFIGFNIRFDSKILYVFSKISLIACYFGSMFLFKVINRSEVKHFKRLFSDMKGIFART